VASGTDRSSGSRGWTSSAKGSPGGAGVAANAAAARTGGVNNSGVLCPAESVGDDHMEGGGGTTGGRGGEEQEVGSGSRDAADAKVRSVGSWIFQQLVDSSGSEF
jgi:hypothetical protein